jgi:hypothetical protein
MASALPQQTARVRMHTVQCALQLQLAAGSASASVGTMVHACMWAPRLATDMLALDVCGRSVCTRVAKLCVRNHITSLDWIAIWQGNCQPSYA